MVRQTAFIIAMEILGGLILLVIVLAGLLFLRLSGGPIDLSVFRDDVEAALVEARGGRAITLESLQLEWSAQNRRLEITARDVRLMDEAGRQAGEAERALILVSGSSLVMGEIDVLSLRLSRGWIAIDQISSRQWAIAGSPMPPFAETVLPDTPQGWIDYLEEGLPQWIGAAREAARNAGFDEAGIDDFEIRFRNQQRETIGAIAQVKARLGLTGDGVSLRIDGSGLGQGLPEALSVSIDGRGHMSQLEAGLVISGWLLGDFAARLGFDPGLSEAMASNIELNLDLSEMNGVEQVRVDISSGPGQLALAGRRWPVRDLDLGLVYMRSVDRLDLTLSSREAGPFQGTADITIDEALTGGGPRAFSVVTPAVNLDLTPLLEAPVALASASVRGRIDLERLAISEVSASAVTGGGRIEIGGELALNTSLEEGPPRLQGELTIAVPGPFPVAGVLDLWPVSLGEGARRFASAGIKGGHVHDLNGRLRLTGEGAGRIAEDDLDMTFRVENTSVRFLEDLPEIRQVHASARLTGNSFRVLLRQGTFSGWQIDEGLVDFPAFFPRGQDFRVFARGRGPASGMMKALAESRLDIDFEPERLSGEAEMTFELFRPALSDVPYESLRFTGLGLIRDAGLSNAALGFDLTGGLVRVSIDQDGAILSGDGRLGPSAVSFRWQDGFSDGGAPARLTGTGMVSGDFLNRLGLPGRAYITGEAPVLLSAELDGSALLQSELSADLTMTRLDISEIGWIKPAGEQAEAEILYQRQAENVRSVIRLVSPTARLDADFILDGASRLLAASLREAFFRNVADVSGSVTRDTDDRLDVHLTGRYLDISGLLPGLDRFGSVENEVAAPPELVLEASVDRLTLRPELDLTSARLFLATGSDGALDLKASGLAAGVAPLQASLVSDGKSPAYLSVQSGDAGFLASAVMEADFIEGGQFELTGTMGSPETPGDFRMVINGARMRNAPFLTQILSLASLRGLADTLGGEGVMFSRMEIPLKMSAGRYVIDGARAQGPALGLTASGYVDMTSRAIEIDGVLVPSFGVNSALGGIPIIGDLVVGRDGEGVFSLTYSVRGSLEKASIAVNPLSALAPGVIRRIFENPSDTTIPEARSRPAGEAPPSGLPTITEETF